jgi:hypothetical protein
VSAVGEAYVRIRADFSGFKEATLTGTKENLQEVDRAATATGRTIQEEASRAVQSKTKERAALQETMEAYKQLAAQAVRGSAEEKAANELAAASARNLGVSVSEGGSKISTFREEAKKAEDGLGGFTRGAIAGTGAFKEFGAALLFGGGAFVAGSAIVETVKKSIEQAADLEDQVARTESVFGESADAMKAWAATAADAMGLSKSAALEASGTIGTLLENVGEAPEKAAQMSQSMVQLAADMAAFKKVDVSTALSALESGLQGRTRSLKQFGLVIDNTTLKAEALSSGILKSNVDMTKVASAQTQVGIATEKLSVAVQKHGQSSYQAATAQLALNAAEKGLQKSMAGSTGQLTAQQKTLAAYNLILKQTQNQQGSFGRDQDELTVQQARFTANLHNLEAEIGTALLPVVTEYTKKLADWMSDASNSERIQRDVTQAVQDFEGVMSVVGEVVKTGADAFNLLSDALGGAGHAVEVLGGLMLAYWKRDALKAAIAGDVAELAVLDTSLETTATVAAESSAAAAASVATIGDTALASAGGVSALSGTLLTLAATLGGGALGGVLGGNLGGSGGSTGSLLGGGIGGTIASKLLKGSGTKGGALGVIIAALANPSSVAGDKTVGSNPYPEGSGSYLDYADALKGRPYNPSSGQNIIGPGHPLIESAAYKAGLAEYEKLKSAKDSVKFDPTAIAKAIKAAQTGAGVIPKFTSGDTGGGAGGLSATAVADMRQSVNDLLDKSKGVFPDALGDKLRARGAQILGEITKGLGPDAAAKVRSDVSKFSSSVSDALSFDKFSKGEESKVSDLNDKLSQIANPATRSKLKSQVDDLMASIDAGTAGGRDKIQKEVKGISDTFRNDLKIDTATTKAKTQIASLTQTIGQMPEVMQEKVSPGLAQVNKLFANIASPADLEKAQARLKAFATNIKNDTKIDTAVASDKAQVSQLAKQIGEFPTDAQQALAPGLAALRTQIATVVTSAGVARAKTAMQNLAQAVQTEMDALKSKFEQDWSNMASVAMSLFDRQTQQHIDTMTAALNTATQQQDDQLNATLAAIQAQQSALTPTEQIVQNMQDAKNTADLAKQISDAQKQLSTDAAASAKNIADAESALAKAQTDLDKANTQGPSQATIQKLTDALNAAEAKVAAAQKNTPAAARAELEFLGAENALAAAKSAMVDPDTLQGLKDSVTDAQGQLADAQSQAADQQVSDQDALNDALYSQQLDALQKQAALERTAADTQAQIQTTAAQNAHDAQVQALNDEYNAAVQNYQDLRDLQATALQDQLNDLETSLEARGESIDDFNTDVLSAMKNFGLDPTWFTAGQNSASALIAGFASAASAAAGSLSTFQTGQGAGAVGAGDTTGTGASGAPELTSENGSIVAELQKQTKLLTKPAVKVTVTTGNNSNFVAADARR